MYCSLRLLKVVPVLREVLIVIGLMDAHISLSVCKGQRPDLMLIPQGAASKLVRLIDLCWMQDPAKRPTFAGNN